MVYAFLFDWIWTRLSYYSQSHYVFRWLNLNACKILLIKPSSSTVVLVTCFRLLFLLLFPSFPLSPSEGAVSDWLGCVSRALVCSASSSISSSLVSPLVGESGTGGLEALGGVGGIGLSGSSSISEASRTISILTLSRLECPKYFMKKQYSENIWRRVVHRNLIHNSPSNILLIYASFKSKFQKYERTRQYLSNRSTGMNGLIHQCSLRPKAAWRFWRDLSGDSINRNICIFKAEIFMLLVTDFANIKWCKKAEKWLKPWH